MKSLKPTLVETILGFGLAAVSAMVLAQSGQEVRITNLETAAQKGGRFTGDDGIKMRIARNERIQHEDGRHCTTTNRLTRIETTLKIEQASPFPPICAGSSAGRAPGR